MKLVSLLLFACLSVQAGAANLVQFDTPVKLSGVLENQIAPADQTASEKPETYYALKLDEPIDIAKSDNGGPIQGLTVVQVGLLNQKSVNLYKSLKGQHVDVVCELDVATTAHHYTQAVCFTSDIRAAKKPAIPAQSKSDTCHASAALYRYTAELRNGGSVPPQNVVDYIAKQKPNLLPRAQIVDIVNQVYFDSRFERAGGDALYVQMLNLCLYGTTSFKPAK